MILKFVNALDTSTYSMYNYTVLHVNPSTLLNECPNIDKMLGISEYRTEKSHRYILILPLHAI